MKAPLIKRHKDLLDFIRAQLETHGIAPSYDEMRDFLGYASKAPIHRLLSEIEASGLIRRRPRQARAIELLKAKDYHAPDCDCDGCAETRYFEQLKMIKGLKVDPPVAITRARLDNIRPLDPVTRAELLGQSHIAAPRTRKTALPQGAC